MRVTYYLLSSSGFVSSATKLTRNPAILLPCPLVQAHALQTLLPSSSSAALPGGTSKCINPSEAFVKIQVIELTPSLNNVL